MSLVTLLTCTGGRPEAFNLCQKYMARQSYTGEIQWIVVTDFPNEPIQPSALVEARKNIKMEVYFGPRRWEQGINTQRYNMEEAIKHVRGDYILTVEDDDRYSIDYLDLMVFLLQKFDIVGEANSHYYNIKERKFKEWRNYQHTSLNETGLRANKIKLLDRAVNSGQLFFDMVLWQIIFAENHSHLIFDWNGYVVGMKGLPGKGGIGGGHFPDATFKDDRLFEVLRAWVGLEDAKEYISIAQKVSAKNA